MATLGIYPPTEQAQEALAAIAGIRFTEGEVFGVDGPDGHLGPEAAGCLMVLHATMADAEGQSGSGSCSPTSWPSHPKHRV